VTPLAAPNSGVLVSRLLPVADLSVASDLEHDPGKQWGRLVVGWALHRVGVLGNRHGQQYQRLQLSEGAATLFQSNHSPASAATPAPIWCAWTASRASPVQWPVARRSPAQVSSDGAPSHCHRDGGRRARHGLRDELSHRGVVGQHLAITSRCKRSARRLLTAGDKFASWPWASCWSS